MLAGDSVVVLDDGLDAGAAVSVFCSQAANKAAPVRMQINRFIIIIRKIGSMLVRSENASRLSDLQRRFVFQGVCLGHCATG